MKNGPGSEGHLPTTQRLTAIHAIVNEYQPTQTLFTFQSIVAAP